MPRVQPRQPTGQVWPNNSEMNSPDTDLIFPPRVIALLNNDRGAAWRQLVSTVEITDPVSPEQMAFILMMARLNNCAACNADSYRAIHGCTACAKQTLRRFHGSDEDLCRLYKIAKTDVMLFIQNKNLSHMPLNGIHKSRFR
jgi:hypothetical protein